MKNFFSRPIAIAVSLALILTGCLIGNHVQTDRGNAVISDVRIVGDSGNVLSALLYRPKDADPSKPLPAVLTMHGNLNSREVQDPFNIEFVRRGYVVLSMDMAGMGYSEPSAKDPTSGALSGLSYLRNLAFVDKSKIAVEGHSLGGAMVLSATGVNPDWVNTVIQVGSTSDIAGAPKVLADTPYNYAVIFGKYDEFTQPIWGVPTAEEIVNTDKLKNAFGTNEAVIPGKLYGSYHDKSARMFYIPPVTHPGDHWSKTAVGDAINFLQQAIPAPKPIDHGDQVWRVKEYATFSAMIGAFLLLFSVAGNLLRTHFFRTIVQPIPETKGAEGVSWIFGALLATAIPAVFFFKFQEWGAKWFPVGSFWPQSYTNGFVTWMLLNAIIAIALFAAWHYAFNKKTGATPHHYGLSYSREGYSIDLKSLGKSLLLSLYSIGAVYAVTLLIGVWFKLDFRIWFIGLKVMSPEQFLMLLKYGVPLLMFFLAKGLLMHGQFRLKPGVTETGTAWKWFLANAGINTLGIIVLILIQYLTLFTTEKVFWGMEALLIVLGLQFVLVNIVEALISTYFFRRTGRIYAGAFANTLLITWFIVAGQATQYAGQTSSNAGAISVFIVSCVVATALFFWKRTKAASSSSENVPML